jgi:hypothetical protein
VTWRVRDLCLIVGVAVLAWSGPAHSQNVNWPPLVPLEADSDPLELVFREERWITFLTEPVISTGTFSIAADGRLIKTVLTPIHERMTVVGPRVSVERPPGTEVGRFFFSLSPVLEAVVSTIRALAAADRSMLEANFEVSVSGTDGDWSMDLVPINPSVRSAVEIIAITGADEIIHRVVVLESDGTRSVLFFDND